MLDRPAADPTRLDDRNRNVPQKPPWTLDEILFRGFFPRVHHPGIDPVQWLSTYEETYVERDVRRVQNIGQVDTFRRFVRLCAGRTGQILNLSSLANDTGISPPTARAWLSALEATYLVRLLPPHPANFNKRVIKSPKIHFTDTGLACRLLGIRSPADLVSHPLRGALVETLVVGEMTKAFLNRGETPPLFYWRNQTGLEIDLLVDLGVRLVPWEITSVATVRDEAFASLRSWNRLAGFDPPGGGLIHAGEPIPSYDGFALRTWYELS